MAWGALIGAGASLLGSYLGGGNKYQPEWLSPQSVRNQMLQGTEQQRTNLGDLYGDYRGLAGQLQGQGQGAFTRGTGFLNQANQLMSGTSPILEAMRQQQSQQLGDVGSMQMMGQNRAMAARGQGGGGLSSILGTKTTSALGEQSKQGLLGIQQYGLQAGQGFGQLGSQMYGQAAGLGQAASGAFSGARGTQQDILQLQTGANAAAANQMAANNEATNRYNAQQFAQGSQFGGNMGGMVGQAFGQYGAGKGWWE